MKWDDIATPLLFKEGEKVNYADSDGVYYLAEIVRVTCPICSEEFIGNKRHAGGFIEGNQHYNMFIDERAEYFGGI